MVQLLASKLFVFLGVAVQGTSRFDYVIFLFKSLSCFTRLLMNIFRLLVVVVWLRTFRK